LVSFQSMGMRSPYWKTSRRRCPADRRSAERGFDLEVVVAERVDLGDVRRLARIDAVRLPAAAGLVGVDRVRPADAGERLGLAVGAAAEVGVLRQVAVVVRRPSQKRNEPILP
jgi:hypothetical protein